MAKFSYTARSINGQVTQGTIEAGSETEVRIRLKNMNVEPTRIVASGNAQLNQPSAGMFAARVNSKELQVFTRQFATLINAGIPVVDALKILGDGLRPGLLKEAAQKIRVSIEGGRRLADAMAQNPRVFDRLYCNMIQAGEEAGILDGILNRLAIYMEKSEKIKGQIKGAMILPIAIIFVAILVITGILVFVLPKLTEFFVQSGKELPALTQMVVNLSNAIIHNWPTFLAVLIGAPIMFMQWINTDDGKNVMDRFLIRFPVIGDVVLRSSVARMTRTLSTLLSSGVGLIEAIEIAARTSGNIVIEEALMRSKESVTQGRTFAAPLLKEKVIPEMVVQMIAIGEQSGTMDTMLGKVADFYEDEVETAVKAMASTIEPVMMVVLGGIIAVIVVAMYLPIFGMADAVGG